MFLSLRSGAVKAPAHCPDAVGKALDGSVIEVDIGKGGKKTIGQKGGAGICLHPCLHGGMRKADQFFDEQILQKRCGRLLAADARFDAAGISGSLLTLKTEHI